MIVLLFFLVSFLTVFLSIKLSIYADNLSKSFNISNAIIGGVLLAGITSLPELITCISSIALNNSELAFGDIFGSNLFNIFVISFFDIVYFKKRIFNNINKTHLKIFILLIINYLFIFLYMIGSLKLDFLMFSFPSIVIFLLYFIYLFTIKKNDNFIALRIKKINHVVLKIIVTSLCMVVSSILLTFVVNKISVLYPLFSSSVIGAILLGITTSLPEVITFYTLIVINNYDMAIDDIIGSNLFNLFIIAIGDCILKSSIYVFYDMKGFIIFILCFLFGIISFIQCFRKKIFSSFVYLIPSFIMFFLYLMFWIYSFKI